MLCCLCLPLIDIALTHRGKLVLPIRVLPSDTFLSFISCLCQLTSCLWNIPTTGRQHPRVPNWGSSLELVIVAAPPIHLYTQTTLHHGLWPPPLQALGLHLVITTDRPFFPRFDPRMWWLSPCLPVDRSATVESCPTPETLQALFHTRPVVHLFSTTLWSPRIACLLFLLFQPTRCTALAMARRYRLP